MIKKNKEENKLENIDEIEEREEINKKINEISSKYENENNKIKNEVTSIDEKTKATILNLNKQLPELKHLTNLQAS